MYVVSLARSILDVETGCITALREESLNIKLVVFANTTPSAPVVVRTLAVIDVCWKQPIVTDTVLYPFLSPRVVASIANEYFS